MNISYAQGMYTQNPEFTALLEQMAELIYMPLDAREQFEAMLQANFEGLVTEGN